MGEKLGKFSKRDIVLIILALLVIAWAAYFYMMNRGYLRGDAYQVSNAQGELIKGFPTEFVFESGVALKESARTASKSENFWSASYISSKTSQEIFSLYKNGLEFLGWEITNSSPNAMLFAKKAGMQISVSIQDEASRREVLLSILER